MPEGWPAHAGSLLKYRVAIRFGEELDTMPDGWKFGGVSAVTTDSKGEVYVFHRGKKADPLVVFDAKGNYLRSWGRDFFGNPHGLRADREDNIWAVDNGNHQVYKFTREGKLLQTWGVKGQIGTDDKTFGRPTDIAFATNGDFYVSDGYGNSRVVKFDKNGKYLLSWGKRGNAPGEFHIVHSVAVDSKDRVYVSDRENNRIQIFSPDGKFLKQWTHLGATQGLFITPSDEMWIITHRNNVENITYDTLAGQIMKIEVETGKILGAMESPGHMITAAKSGEIFVASLTGNLFRWYPAWLTTAGASQAEEKGAASEKLNRPEIPGKVFVESGRGGRLVLLAIIHQFKLGRSDVANRFERPAVIEPINPIKCCVLGIVALTDGIPLSEGETDSCRRSGRT